MKIHHNLSGKSRLGFLKQTNPEKAARIEAQLEKIKANRENGGQEDSAGSPSMTWTKNELIEHAEKLGVAYQSSWTKQEILDAIEAHET